MLVALALPNLSEVRRQYSDAADGPAKANKLNELLSSVGRSDSKTLLAYKGAAMAMKAKFAGTREDRKTYFTEGVALLEYAAKSEPNNLEIRLVRLSIQENTPKIMNYKKEIAGDKAFIMQHLETQNGALQTYARNYIQRSKAFSTSEKLAFQ